MRGAANRVGVALDFLSDLGVLSFASWTLFAYIGMITGGSVNVLTVLWLLTTPLLAAFLLLPRFRATAEPGAAPDEPPSEGSDFPQGRQGRLYLVAVLAGIVAGFLAANPGGLPWGVVWIPALVAAVATVLAGKLLSRAGGPVVAAGWPAEVFAASVGLAFAALSMVVNRGNADDAFYVNRATAVRQLGHIPVLDVIFTHEEVARAGGAGLPNDSYSALQGAVARLFGVAAPSVAYFLFPPVFTFLATWAMWRLVRAWAPRYAWLCFAVASVFWIWSSQYPLTSGSYFLSRIWQGKVALVAWLIPTLYVYLTRWVGGRDARTAVLLLAAGLCSIGLTGSATFVIPLVALVAVIPLLAGREWGRLAVPVAAAAVSFGIGMFLLLRYPLSESIGNGILESQAWFYHQAVGSGFVGAVAALGVWVAPWVVRRGPPQRIAAGLVIVFALLMAPGAIELLRDVSGLTGTLRRILWIAPFPALVGMLVVAPLPRRVVLPVRIAAAVAASALLIVFGRPLWLNLSGNSTLNFPPQWHALRIPTARAILSHYDSDKPILAERTIMLAISIITAEPKAVNARSHYLEHTDLSEQEIAARLTLTDFITKTRPEPTQAVRDALDYLDVGLVCVGAKRKAFIPAVERLGPYREAFKAGGEVCAERLPAAG